MTSEKQIKEAMKSGKALLGSKSVMRAAMNGRLSGLIYAKNVPATAMNDIRHYSGISGLDPQEFPGNSLELGELCGKPFGVLLFGIRK
jgi:large subunit ribosomal protein L30e